MKKSKMITLRISDDAYQLLKEYSIKNGISVSRLIRNLFDRFVRWKSEN